MTAFTHAQLGCPHLRTAQVHAHARDLRLGPTGMVGMWLYFTNCGLGTSRKAFSRHSPPLLVTLGVVTNPRRAPVLGCNDHAFAVPVTLTVTILRWVPGSVSVSRS